MAIAAKRFAIFSDEELAKKTFEVQNTNTLKNEHKAERIFVDFLKESGVQDLDFYLYTETERDKDLAKFWFCARKKKNGDMYEASSLDTITHGLNRALKHYGHEFDITKATSTSFIKSIMLYIHVVTVSPFTLTVQFHHSCSPFNTLQFVRSKPYTLNSHKLSIFIPLSLSMSILCNSISRHLVLQHKHRKTPISVFSH